MTFLAIPLNAILCEFSLMIVLMAVHTGSEVYRIGIAALMTFLTVHIYVLALKGIISDTVIEEVHCLEIMKALLRMTFGAVITEFAIVYILMTCSALIDGDSIAVLEYGQWVAPLCMTGITID
jgi:hypothetical protein